MEETIDTSSHHTKVEDMTFIEHFEEAKNLYECICKNRDNLTDKLNKLSQFIQMIIIDPSLLEQKEEFNEYFYDKFAEGLLHSILYPRSQDNEYLDIVAVIVKQFTQLLAKDLKHKVFLWRMATVFDYTNFLHMNHYKVSKSCNDEWRYRLKVGDRVDSVKTGYRSKCWGIAVISFIYGNTLELQFENDSSIHDISVNRYSSEIELLGTYTKENDFKYGLKVGDKVDALSKARGWFPSIILDFKEHMEPNGRLWQITLIGFRYFDPNGSWTDQEGNRYYGWDESEDEYIPLCNSRIAKLHSHTSSYFSRDLNAIGVPIDDRGDSRIEENSNQIYAVLRPLVSTSNLLIECLNLFGSEGGYEKMLELIRNDSLIGLNLLDDLLCWFSKSFSLYHKNFIRKFAPDIKNAIKEAIIKMPIISRRNFKRKQAESVVLYLTNILRRVYSSEQVKDEIEKLKLEIIKMFLRSNEPNCKRDGMMILSDILYQINSKRSMISPENMKNWIDDNQILSILFDTNNICLKSIRRSEAILNFYVYHGYLDDEKIDSFCMAMNLNREVKKRMYDIFIYTFATMTEEHRVKFLNKLKTSEIEEVDHKLVRFVLNMSCSHTGDSENTLIACQLLCQFAARSKVDKKLYRFVIYHLTKLLKNLKYNSIQALLYDFLDNLKNNRVSVESIKLMKLTMEMHLISKHSNQISFKDKTNKINLNNENKFEDIKASEESKDELYSEDLIEHFIQNEGLIDVLKNDLTTYCKTVQSKLANIGYFVKIKKHCFEGRYNHKISIKCRLKFLTFLASNSSYKINFDELSNIFNLLMNESQIHYDKVAVLKWLKNSTKQQDKIAEIFNLQDENVKSLIQEKLS